MTFLIRELLPCILCIPWFPLSVERPPDILFIAVDDLRADVGCCVSPAALPKAHPAAPVTDNL